MGFIRDEDAIAVEAERMRLHELARELDLPVDVIATNQVHRARQSVRETRAALDDVLDAQHQALL